MRTNFSLRELPGRDDLEDRGVEFENFKLNVTEGGLEGFDWFYLAQYSGHSRAGFST
jgi:hypothetical protein